MSQVPTDPYVSNLAALAARSGRFVELIRGVEPYPLEVLRARSGAPSARTESTWLHSRYDPEAEGRLIAAEAVATGPDLVIALGLGLGYAVKAVMEAGVSVVAIEVDETWLAALLRAADLAPVIADERCALILCPGGRGLGDFLDDASPRSIAVIENRAMLAAFPEAAQALKEQVERYRLRDEINAATLRRFGRLWVRNLSRNVLAAASSPGVSALAGRLSGLPALVVAAGPSLDELLDSFPRIAQRFVVICVDTALRSVLRTGLQPDFVVVVDPQYWNARHLDHCVSPRSVLVTEAAVWPSVLRFSSRHRVVCSSIYPLGRYVEERVGPVKGALGAGGSVATTAWDFARVMGCAPVFMAGLDLSFPGGRTHAFASLFEQRSLASGTRLEPASSSAFEAMRGGRPFQTTANDGSTVTSDERLSLYSGWFTRRIAAHPETPTWNLSGHGLAIPGMPCVRSQDLLAYPPVRAEIESRIEASLAANQAPSPVSVESILCNLTIELERIAGMADKAVDVASRATGSSGAALDAALAELSRIDRSVLESHARDVVGFLFSSAAEAVGGRARTFDESLDRTVRLYSAVAESARWHASRLSDPSIR